MTPSARDTVAADWLREFGYDEATVQRMMRAVESRIEAESKAFRAALVSIASLSEAPLDEDASGRFDEPGSAQVARVALRMFPPAESPAGASVPQPEGET